MINALLIVLYLLLWAFLCIASLWQLCFEDYTGAALLALVAWLAWRAARATDELDRLKK